MTFDVPSAILKGDLAVDNVVLASNNQPRSSDQVVISGDSTVTGTLTVQSDVTLANGTSTSILSAKNLTLGQTRDQHGDAFLHIRNRSGENGVILHSTNASTPLIDLIARLGNSVQRNIRCEGRSANAILEAPTWEIGGAPPTVFSHYKTSLF